MEAFLFNPQPFTMGRKFAARIFWNVHLDFACVIKLSRVLVHRFSYREIGIFRICNLSENIETIHVNWVKPVSWVSWESKGTLQGHPPQEIRP